MKICNISLNTIFFEGKCQLSLTTEQKRGIIVINLGDEYAGCEFTVYEGRKSTSVKVTEGVLDENGRYTLDVDDGKNYTLIVEE